MSKKKVLDPAIKNAEKTPDRVFERGGIFVWDKVSTVKEFGVNKLLKGARKNKRK